MISNSPSQTPRRVVITGMGAISPLASTLDEMWDALTSGRSGVSPMTLLPTDGMPVTYAGEAVQFTGKIDCFGQLDNEQKKAIRKGLKVMCRECQMGVAAAQLTLDHAGIGLGSLDPDRTGINFGADYMLSIPEEFTEAMRASLDPSGQFDFSKWPGSGMPQMSPLWLLKFLPNMPASHLAIYNDFRGPNNSITEREAAANMALGEAARIIFDGRADRMLAGATGTRLNVMKLIHCVQQAEIASPTSNPAEASRPFDADRTGMVLAEGAGAVMLEELASAKARGATIYGEVVTSAANTAVGRNLTARPREAMATVLRTVLDNARMKPEAIGHIHAHGLATKTSDVEEALAINDVFGSRAEPVPVVTVKGHYGNPGAGSGMIELIASTLALGRGTLFPVLNHDTHDPECPIHVVDDAQTPAGDSFINLSITPQGQASATLIRRYS